MNIKDIVIGGLMGLVVLLGGLYFFQPVSVSVTPPLGVSAGPDRFNPCESTNGITSCFTSQGFISATTTVCAIQSPNATSTLASAGARFTVSSTTASTVTMAKAATQYATTTAINTLAIAANAQGTLVATTSPVTAGTVPQSVFAPLQWLVIGMQGGIGTFSPTGTCKATFEII